MEKEELNSMIGGYVAGNVIAKVAANNLKKKCDEIEEWKSHHPDDTLLSAQLAKYLLSNNKDEALKFLNEAVMEEYIHYAQHQTKENQPPLSKCIDIVKQKYAPFYERISSSMPSQLVNITDESLCNILGITIISSSTKHFEYTDQGYTELKGWQIAIVIICVAIVVVFFLLLMSGAFDV